MKSALAVLALAAMTAANPDKRPSFSPGYSYDGPALTGAASTFNRVVASRNPVGSLADSIPGGGVPGQDYPVLASVPDTGFSCASQQLPGYYADTAPQAGCQVFHICQFDGRQDSFLCPNGSIFNQQYFICDWWFNVDCAASQQFVSLNADIGKVSAGGFVGSASSLSPTTAYGPPRRAGSSSNGFGQGSSASRSFGQGSSASRSFGQGSSGSSSFGQGSSASSSFGQGSSGSSSFGQGSSASSTFGQGSSGSSSFGQGSSGSSSFGQGSSGSSSFGQGSANGGAASSNSFSQVASASSSFNQVASASSSFSQAAAAPSQSYGVPA